MNTEQIEQLAVKHEAFGFGLVDAKGYTTHGFDPEGLHAFVTELTEALAQERDALFGSQELIAHVAATLSERMTSAEAERDKLAAENKVLRDALGNHVYTFRRRGQDNFCTCDKARYLELKDKPSLFEVAILYTRSKS